MDMMLTQYNFHVHITLCAVLAVREVFFQFNDGFCFKHYTVTCTVG